MAMLVWYSAGISIIVLQLNGIDPAHGLVRSRGRYDPTSDIRDTYRSKCVEQERRRNEKTTDSRVKRVSHIVIDRIRHIYDIRYRYTVVRPPTILLTIIYIEYPIVISC
jgi:hypothetical protein